MASASWMNDLNKNYLQSVGADGQYNRDRLFKQIGVKPTAAGDYSTVSLTGDQQQRMKSLLEQELGQKLEGATIDAAGNVNEPEGFKHYAAKYGPIAGGIALTAFGIPGVMPGLFSGGAAAGGAAASAGTGATGATGGGGMSWLSSLGNFGKSLLTGGNSRIGNVLDLAGSGLGAMSSAQAKNRGTALDAQTDIAQQMVLRDKAYNDALLAYEKDSRAGAGQALAQLRGAEHLNSPNAMPTITPYAAAPRQQTDAERQANDLITQQMMTRLENGSPVPVPQKTDLQIDRSLMNPGTSENITGWLGALMPALGAASGYRRPKPRTQQVSQGDANAGTANG